MIGYIYKITSPSGRIYIGQTSNMFNRTNYYKGGHCKGQVALYNSISKYGWHEHKLEILETRSSEMYINEVLNSLEVYYVAYYKSNYSRYPSSRGMNLTDGGGGMRGYKMSKESIQKMSNSKKGISTITSEGRIRLSRIHKERVNSKESIEKHTRNRVKPVLCIDTNNIYASAKHVSEKININWDSIHNVCSGRAKTAGNLRFKYITKDEYFSRGC